MTYSTVKPIPLMSPNGGYVRPRLNTYRNGTKIITEALWICPKMQKIFKKGIVSIVEDKAN